MEQLVQFYADKPAPPPATPLAPGVHTALNVLRWFFGLMLIPAAIGVAAMNSAFLAGSSSMQLQWPSAIVVGIIAALGLCILLVAGGITWKSLPPVSIMAFGLFGLCLWLALQAAGGFSYFTSRPLPIHENPLRFDNEPRHIEAIDRDISRFLSQEREYRGERGGWVVTNGAEILSRTDQCAAFHHILGTFAMRAISLPADRAEEGHRR